MSGPFTRQDMVDAIATAITDSMGPDWNSHIGAESVVRNCGVFELYDALEKAAPFVGWASTRGQIIAGVDAAELCSVIDSALAKARGGQ